MTNRPEPEQHVEKSLEQILKSGIRAARKGEKGLARRLLLKAAELDPTREEIWLWLSGVAENTGEAMGYLQTVLALDPNNQQARKGLQWMERHHPQAKSDGMQAPSPQSSSTASIPKATLPTSLTLSVEQAEAIDACLEQMAYESEARCIILADTDGQLVAERGQIDRVNTQVLSALAAGELAATQEMARLVGEEARFKLLLHEGESQSVYLSDVGAQLILVIVFDNGTPIGLVRMILKQAVEELAPILEASEQETPHSLPPEALDNDFARLLEDELSTTLTQRDR